MKKDVTLIQDFSGEKEIRLFDYPGKVLENAEGPHADPGLFLDKRNMIFWSSRKSPGKTKKDVTLILGFSWKTKYCFGLFRKSPGGMKKGIKLIEDFS